MKNLFFAAIVSIFVTIAQVILNSSFSYNGVDLSEYKDVFFNDFGTHLLFSFAKVLILQIGFYLPIYLCFFFLFSSRKIAVALSFFFLVAYAVLGILKYPQVYSEFFFTIHPNLEPVLFWIVESFSFPVVELGFLLLLAILFLARYKTLTSRNYLFYLLFIYGSFTSQFLILLLAILWASFVEFFPQKKFANQIRINFLASGLLVLNFFNPNFRFFSSTNTDPQKPNVFIISGDSLRSDILNRKKNGIEISPNLNKFSETSIIFRDHHTTIPRTFPSWADTLSGVYSMQHGIRDMFPSKIDKSRLGSTFPTLPQKFAEHGYSTAVISNFAGDIFPRANFGFETIDAPTFDVDILTILKVIETQVLFTALYVNPIGNSLFFDFVLALPTLGDGQKIIPKFQNYVTTHKKDPMFVTFFTSIVHFPYSPPHPYYKKFTNSEYRGKYKFHKFYDPTKEDLATKEEKEQIYGLYDSSVAAFDDEFGSLIQFLKKEDLYDSSFIIVTSDHGESLFESNLGQGHGEHLRGEGVTRIPLLIKPPKNWINQLPLKIDEISSSIDIYPTLLSILGESPKNVSGVNLFSKLENSNVPTDSSRNVYVESGIWFSDLGDQFFQEQRIFYPSILKLQNVDPENRKDLVISNPEYSEKIAFSKHRALINSQYKLIYIPTRNGVQYECYDRKADPWNDQNLWPLPACEELKQKLQSLVLEKEGGKWSKGYFFPKPMN